MAYATPADIIALYGSASLYVADHDRDGEADSAAVLRALEAASEEIDSYIGVRFSLPLTHVPGILRQHAVDIAIYRLALSADVLSEEHRRRYEDALAHLKRIGEGKATLVMPADPDATDAPAITSPRPIVSEGPPRLFSRSQMRDY